MKDNSKPLTPKLRFPEFHSAPAWEATPLRTLATPVTEKVNDPEPCRVLTLSAERGIVLQSDYFVKRVAGHDSERYIKIARNDFVYNDRTTQQSVYGTIKRLLAYEDGMVSPIYKCFRFNAGEDPEFWEWYFESGAHDTALGGLINEGARAGRFNISPDRFLSSTAWRPSYSEQRKIAACLTSLDGGIAAEARKRQVLLDQKKGVMQLLFPREGESSPQLRFHEFYDGGEWSAAPLGKVVEIASGQVDPAEPPYCDLPHVGGDNIESQTGRLSGVKTARELGLISGKYHFNSIDVLYSKIRPALNKVAAPEFEGICSADIYPIRPSNHELRREYLVYLLQSEAFLAYAIKNSARGRIPKINRDALLSYEAKIPPKPEQQRIAACLSSLDDLIAAQSRRLEGLRAHKKGLMEQLFPSLEGL